MWASLNEYGSLGTSTTSGPSAGDLAQLDRRILGRRLGRHEVDADRPEQRRAVGRPVDRHPRPAPDRHERARRSSPLTIAERVRRPAPAFRRRPRAARPTASASSTDRTDVTTTFNPAASSASASSRRFSSVSTTTTSGASATIAAHIGVLRAAHRRQRLVAEPGAGDDVGAQREQGLGRRRDEADDSRAAAGTGAHSPSRRCFWASNSSSVSVPRSRSASSRSSCVGEVAAAGDACGAGRRRSSCTSDPRSAPSGSG